jgi:hypothetical protein
VPEDVAPLRGEDRHPGALADDLELGDGVGALQVGGHEQRGVALVLEPLPSLPASVVLPEPCRPASMMTVGGCLANASAGLPPRMPTSSSLTILTTCWAGVERLADLAPSARSRTAWVKALTTGSATSASSSASRMSRIVLLTS